MLYVGLFWDLNLKSNRKINKKKSNIFFLFLLRIYSSVIFFFFFFFFGVVIWTNQHQDIYKIWSGFSSHELIKFPSQLDDIVSFLESPSIFLHHSLFHHLSSPTLSACLPEVLWSHAFQTVLQKCYNIKTKKKKNEKRKEKKERKNFRWFFFFLIWFQEWRNKWKEYWVICRILKRFTLKSCHRRSCSWPFVVFGVNIVDHLLFAAEKGKLKCG